MARSPGHTSVRLPQMQDATRQALDDAVRSRAQFSLGRAEIGPAYHGLVIVGGDSTP